MIPDCNRGQISFILPGIGYSLFQDWNKLAITSRVTYLIGPRDWGDAPIKWLLYLCPEDSPSSLPASVRLCVILFMGYLFCILLSADLHTT